MKLVKGFLTVTTVTSDSWRVYQLWCHQCWRAAAVTDLRSDVGLSFLPLLCVSQQITQRGREREREVEHQSLHIFLCVCVCVWLDYMTLCSDFMFKDPFRLKLFTGRFICDRQTLRCTERRWPRLRGRALRANQIASWMTCWSVWGCDHTASALLHTLTAFFSRHTNKR